MVCKLLILRGSNPVKAALKIQESSTKENNRENIGLKSKFMKDSGPIKEVIENNRLTGKVRQDSSP
jgi:hypothetical protein